MDRFDDVEYTVLEQPAPPRRPRLQRWLLAPLASVVIIGSLAAGASAVVTTEDAAPRPASQGEAQKPDWGAFRDCDKGERHGKRERSSSSELKY